MIEYLEKQEGVKLVFDYFACTFPLKVQEDELELLIIEELVKYISSYMDFDLSEIIKDEFATGRFKYQYTVGNSITIRLAGPELLSGYKSCQIELRGQGCREFENRSSKTWIDLFNFFVIQLQGNPTRLDIAIDDYEGKHTNIQKIKETLDKGNYTTSFRIKEYTLIGSEKKGWSLQFGSHKSTQMLVIYDKLKEQLSKGNEVNQDFWTRYEMRFMKEKAYNVVLNIIEHDMAGLSNYIYGLLYAMLDLKKDNTWGEENICHVDTVDYWKDFLNHVEKSQIVKYKVSVKNLEVYKQWVLPIASSYFLIMFLHNGQDFQLTYTSILSDLLDYYDKYDKNKVRKVNQYQKEVGQKLITMKDIVDIKEAITNYISMNSLPF